LTLFNVLNLALHFNITFRQALLSCHHHKVRHHRVIERVPH
jgi:hypothetical protein